MTTPYLKQCLKELDRDIKKLSRRDKLRYIDHYKYGLELGLHGNYPDRFTFPLGEVQITDSLTHKAYWYAYNTSKQFGPLEVESAREFLLAQIEKRKTKFSSKPRYLKRVFWEMLRRNASSP